MAQLTFVVGQRNVDNTRCLHLAQVDSARLLGLHDAHGLHALDGDVMQVGTALGIGVIGIPAGSHGGKELDVVLVGTGIENQRVAQRLEQGEVGIRAVGLLEDIVRPDVLLVFANHAQNTVVHLVHAQCAVVRHGDGPVGQVNLLQCQFLDFLTVVRTAHLILGGHLRILCLEGHRLCRVDAHVDNLVVDAQTIELGGLGLLVGKGEGTVLVEFHGVEHRHLLQPHILEVEHGVLGIRNSTFNMEFLLAT